MEEIKDSVIDNNVKFLSEQFDNAQAAFKFRKNNMKITDMLWISKRVSIDCLGEVCNPKALIMVVLN